MPALTTPARPAFSPPPGIIASAGLEPNVIEAVVCIPTFRRPDMLAATLASLAAQTTSVNFALVIVDNDATLRAGLPAAARFFEGGLQGIATLEPAQGNCHAINRAFALARETFPRADYFLMIDDDEIAAPNWLDSMVQAAKTHDADLVGGPVFPVFPADAPANIRAHPVFWPAYTQSGPIPMIYGSGNCLITRRAFAALDNPDFDIRYNFLGGGDTDFFTRCQRAGLRAVWANGAEIHETVPPQRTKTNWILKRGLRIGAINFELDRRYNSTKFGALTPYLKNLALLPLSCWRAAKVLSKSGNMLQAAHPLAVVSGRILAGFKLETQQYRANPAAPDHK